MHITKYQDAHNSQQDVCRYLEFRWKQSWPFSEGCGIPLTGKFSGKMMRTIKLGNWGVPYFQTNPYPTISSIHELLYCGCGPTKPCSCGDWKILLDFGLWIAHCASSRPSGKAPSWRSQPIKKGYECLTNMSRIKRSYKSIMDMTCLDSFPKSFRSPMLKKKTTPGEAWGNLGETGPWVDEIVKSFQSYVQHWEIKKWMQNTTPSLTIGLS